MKERFKTFLLISLVSISIIITQKLWIEVPTSISHAFDTGKEDESAYALSDMIVANKYLLNFNSRNHTLVYDDTKYGMWVNSKKSLAEVLSSKNITTKKITGEEYSSFQERRSIIFYFSDKINTYILTKAWNVKKPNNIVDSMPNVDSIYIYLGNSDPFFVFSDGDEHLAVYDNTIDLQELREQMINIDKNKDYVYYYSMKETLETKNDIFIPFEIKNSLPQVYVSNELALLNYSQKTALAESFFNRSIDYIREIVESNGSSIYVYNQEVLKLNTNGTIEYFQPLEETVKKRNLYQSLNTAAKFISEKSGIQKGMYLAKVEEVQSDNNFGYKLKFRYRVRGIPIIIGNQEISEYIEIDVFNNQVRNYKQYVRKDMNKVSSNIVQNGNMLSAFEAIDKNNDILEELYLIDNNLERKDLKDNIVNEVLSSIEDVTLAYFDPYLKDTDEELIAVWAVKFNHRLLAFDAYNGTLVYER